MVLNKLQSSRPFTAPILEMIVVETPVPATPPEKRGISFPTDILQASDIEQAVKQDVVEAFTTIDEIEEGDIEVDKEIKVRRGMGETTEVTILINVKNTMPEQLVNGVDELINEGYSFSSVRLR